MVEDLRSFNVCLAHAHAREKLFGGEQKSQNLPRVKYWEIIADNLSKAGWSWACVSGVDSIGRTIFVADAHRDESHRFIVRADEELTAFVKLESAFRASNGFR